MEKDHVHWTCRFVELDLTVCKIAQHFLHLRFFGVLENSLFTECLITERIRSLVRRGHGVLKLGSK